MITVILSQYAEKILLRRFAFQILLGVISGCFIGNLVINKPIFYIYAIDTYLVAGFYIFYYKWRINKKAFKTPVIIFKNIRPHVFMMVIFNKVGFYRKPVF